MPTYNISSGLPAYPAGLTDKEAVQLVPLYSAINTLAQRISEVSGNVQYSLLEKESLDRLIGLTTERSHYVTIKASGPITYGQLVTLTGSGTDVLASPADYTNPAAPAHAICNMPSGLASLEYGTAIFMHGKCAGVSGSSFGAQYWLGATGTMQLAKPTGAGYRVQPVAIGLGDAGVFLNIPYLGDFVL